MLVRALVLVKTKKVLCSKKQYPLAAEAVSEMELAGTYSPYESDNFALDVPLITPFLFVLVHSAALSLPVLVATRAEDL